ncbi:hypothetical protein [Streptosporangium sp. NPDC051022]|uniref:phosphoketolase family protein n=1 Tax=Streptosporangium sp. NPDC051022 TaxID=3155752 RepID=UPI0034144C05
MRGHKAEGTTTPFDTAVLNDIDRFHSVTDVIDAESPERGPAEVRPGPQAVPVR